MTTFKTTIVNIFVAIILSSCASFPANKIKLSDYPEIKQEEVKKLDLSHLGNSDEVFGDNIADDQDRKFINDIRWKLDDILDDRALYKNNFKGNMSRVFDSKKPTNCVVKLSTAIYEPMPMTCFINYFTSFFTLFTIPYYCQHIFEAKATLIANNPEPTNNSTNQSKPDSANHQTNKQQTNNTTSPNQTQPKILKEYYFKDKAHEVWSILIPFLLFNDTIWDAQTEKGWGSTIAEQTISEALTRSVIRDASQFSECQKSITNLKKY